MFNALNRAAIEKARSQWLRAIKRFSGNVLLSHTASHAVPSALKSLTSVFEMGTGVTSSPLPPEKFFADSSVKINSDVFKNSFCQMLNACVNYFVAKPHDQLVPVS